MAGAATILAVSGCQHHQVVSCLDSDAACPARCGNGILEASAGEQCDDGNTVDGDGCDSTCQVECNHSGLLCDPSSDVCCPDEWGATRLCHEFPIVGHICTRICTHTNDCYWSFVCKNSTCGVMLCGSGYPNAELNRPCLSEHGIVGWCWPAIGREGLEDPGFGVCADFGNLAQGEVCTSGKPLDRTEDWCDFCAARWGDLEGVCQHFCNWEDAYSDAVYGTTRQTRPCPPGSNCWGSDVLDEAGLRQIRLSICRDIAEEPTCSLVTDQLLSDPAMTCADLLSGRRCSTMDVGGLPTLGQLVGRCLISQAATPGLTPWDVCDPITDVCPTGCVCAAEDFFDGGLGLTRCLPYCDTEHHDGMTETCFDLGIEFGETGGVTPVCTSLSVAYEPLDILPTRLGYCALPL